jgi:amino acid adenylation domain-containing protein
MSRAPFTLLHEPFEARAAASPDATAVVAGTVRWSYAELDRRAELLAGRLRSLGVGPEVLVGVCVERSAAMVAALLAVLKAGGGYVPLDPTYPRERLGFMLRDSRAKVLVTQRGLLQLLPEHAAHRVLLDDASGSGAGSGDDARANAAAAGPRDTPALPENLAYLIYTSGSTGRAKGVAIEHRSAAAFVHWALTVFPAADLAAVLASTSLCFDLSIFEIFVTLAAGGAVVVAANALELPQLPAAGEVTLINTVPSAIAELVRVGGVPPSVRVVNLAGEALPRAVVDDLYGTTAVHAVYNLYGPSEDTTYSTFTRVGRDEGGPPLIGRPLPGTEVLLLGPDGSSLGAVRAAAAAAPAGAEIEGELCLTGKGLARGYFDRPELTAERFLPDPTGAVPGGRLYRTGDLARRLSGGDLHYLGRIDHQVKIRGFRIELGEIEALLARHPGVRECVVVARDDGPGGKRLVAYLALDEPEPGAGELRARLAASLPGYMVPSLFVRLPALPRTLNGKVDRKALPPPGPDATGFAAPYTAPRDATEERLAALWAEMLGLERVGIDDPFLEIGGHSLLAGLVLSRVREVFGIALPIGALLGRSTVAGLAALLVEQGERRPAGETAARGPRRVAEAGSVPASPSQHQLWLFEHLSPGTPTYNVAAETELIGPLRPALLARCLEEIVRRHEPLRTRFVESEGVPLQEVLPELAVPLPVVDLTALPVAGREVERLRLRRWQARQTFDLSRGPLLRQLLLRLSAERWLWLSSIHHIAIDGWSQGVLHRELGALYAASVQGLPSPLSPLPLRYADFALWQRRRVAEVQAAQIEQWRAELAGLEPLDLPTDRPRPALMSYRGGGQPLRLPEALAAGLRALGAPAGATLHMALLAVLQALLARTSGQTDLAVGSPVANRDHPELEGLIGFFLNGMVVRASLAGRPSFRGLLAQVRDRVLACFTHHDLPLSTLIQSLATERDPSRPPLFQVAFQVAPAVPPPALPGIAAAFREYPTGTAKYELEVLLAEVGDRIEGWCEYAADLFDRPTIERLFEAWLRLASEVVADPDRPLAEISLLSAAERHQLRQEWNDTAVAPGPPALLHQAFAAIAASRPDAVALIDGDRRLSYGELAARAERLARRLRAQGVGPEERVGVCLGRSAEMVVALLAVLRAGGAYVPLDPAYPPERLAFMVADSGAAVVLTETRHRSVLPAAGPRTLCLDAEEEEGEAWDGATLGERSSDVPPLAPAVPENLAYLIYTSGSTGRAKGVAIEHRSAVALCRWAATLFTPADLAGVLAVTSICFDLSIFELFLPLSQGGSVILAENALALAGLPAAAAVTLINTVPSALAELLREGRVPAGCRVVNLAGEPLPASLAAEIYRRTGVERVYNLYGPSEDTTYSTGARIDRRTVDPAACGEQGAPEPPQIGRPIAGSRAYLLDGEGLPVAPGVRGELHLAGDGLARGYHERPELTAERFVPDPFAARPGERLYRTGDLCRQRPDGGLQFLGRLDHQVKVRGFRIELGEIEAALDAAPEVLECVVTARAERPGELRLVAYVASAGEAADFDLGRLRARLGRTLPEHMIPAAWVVLGALPRTPNGKVDRKALPAPEAGAPSGPGASGAAPRTATESAVAGIWAGVLGVERIGVRDSFFLLGGHSLNGARVVARLRDLYGIELSLRSLFAAPTLEELARVVDEARGQRRGGPGGAPPPLAPQPRGDRLPLSFAQARLWFLDQLEPASPVYNIPLAFHLRGAVAAAALTAALGEVLRRHEALRTAFVEVDGDACQLIAPPAPFVLPVVDLAALRLPARRAAEVEVLRQREAGRPFDLARPPLLRSLLVALGEEEHALFLTLHHIAADGWSLGVLAREISALYNAVRAGRTAPEPSMPPISALPELTVQYADYALWQRTWWSGGALDEQLAYWTEELAGAPDLLALPTDRPRPQLQSFRGRVVRQVLPMGLAARVAGLARAEGATLFMTLLAAFQALLHRASGQDDVVVGSPIASRSHSAAEGLIGLFLNTLALRARFAGAAGAATFDALLRQVRETALRAFAHQDLPFERLVEALQIGRSLRHSPVFQAMCVLQNAPAGALALDGIVARAVDTEADISLFDLTLIFEAEGEELVAALEHDSQLFERETADRLLRQLLVLLESAVAAPAADLWELPLMTAGERREVVSGARAEALPGVPSGSPAIAGEPFPLLFSRCAAARPQALALLTAGGERRTYAELDRASDRLALLLQRLGVGPDVPVGVCAERSLELAVAFVAILKAGGAYLPLDPEYPRERLALMIDDSGTPLVLASRNALGNLPSGGARVMPLDGCAEDPGVEGYERGNLRAPSLHPQSLAYVIYTSGSTGRPKGTGVPHAALAEHLRTVIDLFGFAEGDRLLHFVSPSFDTAIEEMGAALGSGAALVLRGAELWEPAELLGRIDRLGITVVDLPTAYWVQWAQWAEGDGSALIGPAAERSGSGHPLRLVLVGGEGLGREPAARWLASPLADVPLVNAYGPTEAVVTATVAWVDAALVARATGATGIGAPLAGRAAYVLDRGGEVAPPGHPGELCLGGGLLARGYLGRPELTAERFVPDPFGGEPGARLYRTGDLVRRASPDGGLDFLGRIDQQVKLRGFRIELGEIEAALAAHPQVGEAAVTVREDGAGARSLAAYVTPRGGALDAADLLAFARRRLPPFMVPSTVTILDALPLAPNGKVDRRALPAPGGAPAGAIDGPRDAFEELMREVWAEALGRSDLPRDADFFAAGGHSLLATQLVARVRKLFATELPLRDLFDAPTVGAFARKVREAQRGGDSSLPPLAPRRPSLLAPASFAQARLWFLDRLEPGRATYNVALALDLQGDLSPAALAAALNGLAQRHEALRTRFVERGGEPRQEVLPARPRPLPLVDLGGLPEFLWLRELAALGRLEALRPFDLASAPLWRTLLVRCGARRHVLLATFHHIVFDGWSEGIVRRELAELYRAAAGRSEPALAPVELQYGDFASWQRAWPADRAAAEVSFWRRQLDGLQPLDLPTDRPRPPLQSFRGAGLAAPLPRGLGSALRALGRRQGATRFMILLAAYQALLARISGAGGDGDFAVGSPAANRDLPGLEGIVGFFVNLLPLRRPAARSGEPFRALLARVRETALAAYAHQHLPFEKLVEELAPERSLARSPLVQVVLMIAGEEALPAAPPGLAVRDFDFAPATAKFDLSLSVFEEDGALAAAADYCSDLFEPATVRRWIDLFGRCLVAVAADDGVALDQLALLDAGERAQLLVDWNATPEPRPEELVVHRWFERRAVERPDALALAIGPVRLSYGELDRRANALAHRLRELGVDLEARVAICLERSVEWVVAILAVLKAGGAYVPLVPGQPAERLSRLANDAGAAIVISGRSEEPWVAAATGERDRERGAAWSGVVWSDEIAALGEAEAPPALDVPPDALAYVIFTSGSTGEPKGVAVSHRALAHLVAWHHRAFDVVASDRATQLAGLGFDASVWEVWPYLAAGASLHLPPEELRGAPEGLRDWLAAEAITLTFLPTPLAEAMLPLAWPAGTALRAVLTGGDKLHAAPPASFPCALCNNYGPTENTVVATSGFIAPGGGLVPSIGRPIDGVTVYLLDALGQPVPLGVRGELHLGGGSLARGYLGRAAATAERFVPDPFATAPGCRLYRTGDLARFRADGTLEFAGRADDQVKVRGFRIELGEIEAALARHPDLRESAVIVRPGAAGNRLVAFYVPATEDAERSAELRGFLARALPEYMLPALYCELDALPLSPSGKVDRRQLAALPLPERDAAELAAPRTDTEAKLVEIWRELLEIERIGIADSFFAAGGHSLLATRLVARLRAEFGIELPLRAVFERPTIAELAAAIAEAQVAGVSAAMGMQIAPLPRDGRPLALSASQLRQWFLVQLEPEATDYNLPITLALDGPLDRPALIRALHEIVRRHEVLRMRFAAAGGQPYARVAAADGMELPLAAVDLSPLPVDHQQAELRRQVGAEVAVVFDLERGPLCRGVLFRLGAERHVLHLTVHHIVFDGWSFGVLVRELAELYPAFAAGQLSERAPLPPLAVQYADFAAWQRAWLASPAVQPLLAYWRERLADLPPALELPTDLPRPSVSRHLGGVVDADLPADLAAAIRALAARQSASLFMVLRAVFDALLSRLAGSRDLALGTFIANRRAHDLEPLLGFFVNTLVLRSDLADDPSFADHLERVRRSTLADFEHQDLPFERLLEELDDDGGRGRGRAPLFRAMFGVQNFALRPTRAGQLALAPLDLSEEARVHGDLALWIWEEGGSVRGILQYDAELFERATAERWVGHLRTFLVAALADLDRPLAGLPLLSAGERRQILDEWSRVAIPHDRAAAVAEIAADLTVPEMLARQAARSPDHPAVVWTGGAMTYGELDRLAGDLAGRLRALGVGAERLVAIGCERGPEMIVGLLGVLKAGAAYLPLDPSLPQERLDRLAADARPALLLTQESLLSRFAGFQGEVVCLDARRPVAELPLPTPLPVPPLPPSPVSPDALAYVLYTSGSTGAPKGVMIPHRALAAFTRAAAESYGISACDRVLQFAVLAFDTSVEEVFPALSVGATLVLRNEAMLASPREFLATCRAWGVTVLDLPTAYWHELAAALPELAEELGPPLRRIILGGERALPERIVRWVEACGVEPVLLNTYGPTEATVVATWQSFAGLAGGALAAAAGAIGRPLGAAQVYVLDSAFEPVPVGVVGELYLGGPGLARGYLGRGDLTAERFLPQGPAAGVEEPGARDPSGGAPGARLYRTGDLVRFRAGGRLEFVGRADHQVKIRGFRIEPDEVAAALTAHPAVREAVVVARAAGPGELRLAGYAVAVEGEGARPTPAELREHLKALLPAYMVPADLTLLAELPRTASGKVDRRRLPEPVQPADGDDGYLPPSSLAEQRLAAIWGELLGRQRIGVHDSFFDLGGHSLLVPQVLSRIEDAFGLELPLRLLFEAPALGEMAAAIEAALLREIEELSEETAEGLVADGAGAFES